MTHDERISSYIDNELSAQEEQDFLISLAASDGLRKSFRSELVLKNVLHRDESSTNPPRQLRAAVFATLGIATASGMVAENAKASQMQAGNLSQAGSTGPHGTLPRVGHGLLKALFATKLNILATVATIFASAFAGYGVHSLTTSAPQVIEQSSHLAMPSQMVAPMQQVQQPAVNTQSVNGASDGAGTSSQKHSLAVKHDKLGTIMHNRIQDAESAQPPVNGTAGVGIMKVEAPKTTTH